MRVGRNYSSGELYESMHVQTYLEPAAGQALNGAANKDTL